MLTNSSFEASRAPQTREELKRAIVHAVECEAKNQLGLDTVSEEEFLLANSKCWLKFYTMLQQYDHDARLPLALFVDRAHESLVTLIRKAALSVYSAADVSEYGGASPLEAVRTLLARHAIHAADEQRGVIWPFGI